MPGRALTCMFGSPLQGEGRGFETLSAHTEKRVISWIGRSVRIAASHAQREAS